MKGLPTTSLIQYFALILALSRFACTVRADNPHTGLIQTIIDMKECKLRSNEIRIDTSIVTDFEAGRGSKVARAGNVYLVGVTLLHELVHWGDDQDGIDRPGEEGNKFEIFAYGSVIN